MVIHTRHVNTTSERKRERDSTAICTREFIVTQPRLLERRAEPDVHDIECDEDRAKRVEPDPKQRAEFGEHHADAVREHVIAVVVHQRLDARREPRVLPAEREEAALDRDHD